MDLKQTQLWHLFDRGFGWFGVKLRAFLAGTAAPFRGCRREARWQARAIAWHGGMEHRSNGVYAGEADADTAGSFHNAGGDLDEPETSRGELGIFRAAVASMD